MALFEPATYRLSWLWRGPNVVIEFSPPLADKEYEVSFDPTKDRMQLTEDVVRALKQATTDATDTDKIITAITTTYERRKEDAWKAWQVTLIPPIVLLVLGLCIAWIFRGFRAAT